MEIRVWTLTSALHDRRRIEEESARFLAQIQEHTAVRLAVAGDGMDGYDAAGGVTDCANVIYVRTGGVEMQFAGKVQVRQGRPVYLLTSGGNNSLAASMEILSYVRDHCGSGEILHGSAEYIGRRLTEIAQVEHARSQLEGSVIGVIGQPSDWLIASRADETALRNMLGISVKHIEMKELLEEVGRIKEVSEATRGRLKECGSKYFDGALHIYEALRVLVVRHGLHALTLRCFDLLTALHNTGCLALALLNSEGVPSSCEGDVPALLTMMAAQALTGHSGFQANPSRINPETGEMVFAHCTVPLDMVRDYSYATHFESGIGVALHGELPEGAATLMKVGGDLKRLFVREVTLLRNQYESNLCRTQVVLRAEPETAAELLRAPIANHHIILSGRWRRQVEALFAPFIEE